MNEEYNRRLDAQEEPVDTVLYLVPDGAAAHRVVSSTHNRRFHVQTRSYKDALRITLGCSKPPYLVSLGNNNTGVNMGGGTSSRCRLCFNADGEILLYDESPPYPILVSSEGSLISSGAASIPLMRSGDRQCSINLSPHPTTNRPREYRLTMGTRKFMIYPPFNQKTIPVEQKLSYITQRENKTEWPALPELPMPRRGPVTLVHFAEIERLGHGGQAYVQRVAITKTGMHFACKTCTLDNHKTKTIDVCAEDAARQLKLVKQADDMKERSCIVPWLFYQFRGNCIDIFMPIYWCSLADLINNDCFKDIEASKPLAMAMLCDISTALCLLASQNPAVVHRDIKPENILFKNETFALGDFGVCKSVNNTYTNVGTVLFKAPEVQHETTHTPAMDVFSLGLTLAACLSGQRLEDIYNFYNIFPEPWTMCAQHTLEKLQPSFGKNIANMIQAEPGDRPEAATILQDATQKLEKYRSQGDCPMPKKKFAQDSVVLRQNLQPTVPGPQLQPEVYINSLPGEFTHEADGLDLVPRIMKSIEGSDLMEDVQYTHLSANPPDTTHLSVNDLLRPGLKQARRLRSKSRSQSRNPSPSPTPSQKRVQVQIRGQNRMRSRSRGRRLSPFVGDLNQYS